MSDSTSRNDARDRDATWVRIGCLGDIAPANWARESKVIELDPGDHVLVRTGRGVEMAEVVGAVRGDSEPAALVTILRKATTNDRRLVQRLAVHRVEAVEACRDAIADSGSDAVLLDVDHLFDGGTLLLHFLGSVPDTVDDLTGEVVARYESIVRTSEFAALLEDGCGPGCGTSQAGGCGTGGGCVSCAVRGACGT